MFLCTPCPGANPCDDGSVPETVKPECGVKIEPYIASGNMVTNPGFESGVSPWGGYGSDPSNNWRWRHSESYGLRGSDGYWWREQNIPVEAGAIYELSIWAKATGHKWKDAGVTYWCLGDASVRIEGGPGGLHGYRIAKAPKSFASPTDTGWINFKTTVYAKDNTLTIRLIGDSDKSDSAISCWWTDGGRAGFDDITLRKIEGAESSPGENVNLRVGAWDDRTNFPLRRIRNDNPNWPDPDTGWGVFGVSGAANNIPWTLSSTETVYVQIRDGAGNISNACSDSISLPPPIGTIRGTVYDVTTTGTSCPLSGDTVSGGSVGITGYAPRAANPSYTFSDIPAEQQYVVTITDIPEDYSNPYYCHGSIPERSIWLSADTTEVVDIGLTAIADAWFQTEDGDVHAQTSISDPIPDTVPAAERYCSLLGDGGYPGVVSYRNDYDFDPDSGSKGGDKVSEKGWLANSSYQGDPYGYDYFDGLIEDDDCEPDLNLADGKPAPEVDICKITGNQVIDDVWSVSSGEKLVILIGSDLTIQSNITVAEGGFLAFIVNGEIEIEENVTDLQGVYIANEKFKTSGQNDTQLFGEGMFVGWEKIPLNRKFVGESLNNTLPVETLVFRPDLWINAPEELWKSSYTWQELAP